MVIGIGCLIVLDYIDSTSTQFNTSQPWCQLWCHCHGWVELRLNQTEPNRVYSSLSFSHGGIDWASESVSNPSFQEQSPFAWRHHPNSLHFSNQVRLTTIPSFLSILICQVISVIDFVSYRNTSKFTAQMIWNLKWIWLWNSAPWSLFYLLVVP